MKQFVKALLTVEDCLKYFILVFPGLSIERIKADVYHGPQIRQLIEDEHFIVTTSQLKKNAWKSFKDVVKNFLGNARPKNYNEIVQKLLGR